MKNKTLLIAIVAVVGFLAVNPALAQTCPDNTTAQLTQATLVGEITDTGGDSNLTVYFQYGQTSSYGYQTQSQSKQGLGIFCTTVYSLTPCTTYHFRAVAQNTAGTSYGQNQSFTTQCNPVTVDVKANNSNGPISVSYNSNVTISWTSTNAASCVASGDWSGSKTVNGSQTIQMTQVKTYTFTLTCQDSSQTQTGNDSVTVNVTANPPVVITKPAVVTY